MARRRSVPAAPERAVDRRLDQEPAAPLAGSNDYRTVDLPGLPDDVETGDAWLGVYKSFDGGQRWASTLLPGYPQDTSAAGLASPLKGYQAGGRPGGARRHATASSTTAASCSTAGTTARAASSSRGSSTTTTRRTATRSRTSAPAWWSTSDGATFLDKPWMAVDIPRGKRATAPLASRRAASTTTTTSTAAEARSSATATASAAGGTTGGAGTSRPTTATCTCRPARSTWPTRRSRATARRCSAQIYVKRSIDCGATWSSPMRVTSPADAINQGATLAIDPHRRRLRGLAALLAAHVNDRRRRHGGAPAGRRQHASTPPGKARGFRRTGRRPRSSERIFEHRKKRATPATAVERRSVRPEHQSRTSFRTNAYPAMTVDGSGPRLHRLVRTRLSPRRGPVPIDGDARIRHDDHSTARRSPPRVRGRQSANAAGPSADAEARVRRRQTDARLLRRARNQGRRCSATSSTIDIYAPASARPSTSARRMGTPGAVPDFAPSVQGVRLPDWVLETARPQLEQLQVNPPNLPMFKLGTVPFIGDYIDVAAGAGLRAGAGGRWVYNTAATAQLPVFHAVWTDNRDVRAAARRQLGQLHASRRRRAGGHEPVRSHRRPLRSARPAMPAHATRTSTPRGSAAACSWARPATPSSCRRPCSAVSWCSRRTRPR